MACITTMVMIYLCSISRRTSAMLVNQLDDCDGHPSTQNLKLLYPQINSFIKMVFTLSIFGDTIPLYLMILNGVLLHLNINVDPTNDWTARTLMYLSCRSFRIEKFNRVEPLITQGFFVFFSQLSTYFS